MRSNNRHLIKIQVSLSLSLNRKTAKAHLEETMQQFEGITHLPIARGAYSTACLDLASISGAISNGSPPLLLRLFYPHKLHQSQHEKVSYLTNMAEKWPAWFPEKEYAQGYLAISSEALSKSSLVGSIMRWMSNHPVAPILQNETLAKDQDKFPLMIFSHGYGGCRMTYSILCAELASRGFIVAALEHADGSACAARTINSEASPEWVGNVPFNLPEGDSTTRVRQIGKRLAECQGALDMISKLNEEGNEGEWLLAPLGGEKVDFQQFQRRFDLNSGVVICGHSFGGTTALKALLSGDSFAGAFCLDPWMPPIKRELPKLAKKITVEKPIFFVNYESFQNEESLSGIALFEVKDDDDNNVVTVRNGAHMAASDVPAVLSGPRMIQLKKMKQFLTCNRSNSTEPTDCLDSHDTLTFSLDVLLAWLVKMGFKVANEPEETLDEVLTRAEQFIFLGTEY